MPLPTALAGWLRARPTRNRPPIYERTRWAGKRLNASPLPIARNQSIRRRWNHIRACTLRVEPPRSGQTRELQQAIRRRATLSSQTDGLRAAALRRSALHRRCRAPAHNPVPKRIRTLHPHRAAGGRHETRHRRWHPARSRRGGTNRELVRRSSRGRDRDVGTDTTKRSLPDASSRPTASGVAMRTESFMTPRLGGGSVYDDHLIARLSPRADAQARACQLGDTGSTFSIARTLASQPSPRHRTCSLQV